MVDKKVVAGAAVLALGVGAAYALSKAGAAPVEEGAPEGEVSIVITPLGRPEGFSFDDVQGAWGIGATVTVEGWATAGFPLPDMLLELYDGVAPVPPIPTPTFRKGQTFPSVAIGAHKFLSDTMTLADVGEHTVYGKMVLSNELGSWEFISDSFNFEIGEVPPGEVDIEVVLTTP